MKTGSCCYSITTADVNNGSDVVAACGPLQVIAAQLLASLASHEASKAAIQQVCHFLAASKDFSQALQSCHGLLPVKFGPPTTAEAAASFAGWLAKCGCLIDSLELQLTPKGATWNNEEPFASQRSAELVVAAALKKAAAAAARSSSAGNLHIRSCKLVEAGFDCTAVLQALPGNTLINLDLELRFADDAHAADIHGVMYRLGKVLPSLQQLQQLQLKDVSLYQHEVACDTVLTGFHALTHLTRLVLPELTSGAPLRHLPPSLLELQFEVAPGGDSDMLQLGHLTALTKLTTGEYFELQQHHVLPPNMVELTAGNMTSAACLLPLTKLRELSLATIEFSVPSAEELQQLSRLSALTAVDLTYWSDTEHIDASAGGWGALKLQQLALLPTKYSSLARATLLQLARLTGLQLLHLSRCGVDGLEPSVLADALADLASLGYLSLCEVYWHEPEDAAGNAAALATLLRHLASSWHRMCSLTEINFAKMHINRAAAKSISKMAGLQNLTIEDCQIEECSVIEIALSLKPWLQRLNVVRNPQLTDACLPVLAYAVRGLTERSFWGCTGITQKGLKQYILGSEADGSDSRSHSNSE